ncbi:MAG: TerB family tellurite resistance protein [Gammaproteobacteria bacterium]
MIKFLRKLFKKEKIKKVTIEDINIACAILLIEVSYSDFEIKNEEISSIIKLCSKELNLSLQDSEWLKNKALELHKDTNCFRKYIKLINENYTKLQKKTLLNMAWLVAKSDNIIDKHEEYRIRKLSELLYLDHKDFIKSKVETN